MGALTTPGTGNIVNTVGTYQFDQWDKPVGEIHRHGPIRPGADSLIPVA